MYSNLNVFRLANAMAAHAGRRQEVIARNVANSDTPGYRARDIVSFVEALDQAARREPGPRRTQVAAGGDPAFVWRETETPDAADPNGNSVSLEQEMLRAADARREQDLALAIYKSALGILRTGLGRG